MFQVDAEGLLPLTTALDADHLAERFAATRVGLATGTGLPLAEVLPRTAVSAAQVGLVSRFWSIALASVALHGWVPDLTPDRVRVDPSHRNPSPLALEDPGAGRSVVGLTETVAAVEELVVHGAVAAVTDACREHGRTSANVLVSNAASSLVAAARVLGGKVPTRASHLEAVSRQLLERPWLAAGGAYQSVTVEVVASSEADTETDTEADTETDPETNPAAGSTQFKRTGCCLYYRLPGHGLCPDCVLVRPGHAADDHH
ncbi:(2Fe-2S)-binding protein [Ornithinimicrobium ciconiae]|uniref:(2Fe-2S)-binding protein n=1 Tax=Ornithinimicrobium ciconiae TaxID=2594265 RepID=UPI0013FCFB8E|nr:(2Fe-2S)-binding protein [Ornithinimicrobium ciconiae]